jgi:mevalonate kinase
MKIRASAPSKLILFGEHFVVYGGKGLALPIENRNVVEVEGKEGEEKLLIESSIGRAVAHPDGRFEGEERLRPFLPVYMKIASKRKMGSLIARIISSGVPKGMGTSTSIGAALGAALYEFSGRRASGENLFECGQLADEVAHGGRASGIDSKTVTSGRPQLFWREFNPPSFRFEPKVVEFPKGTAILVVDTFRGKRDRTADTIARFARAYGIKKGPDEIGDGERKRLLKPYDKVADCMLRELRSDGDPVLLGSLFNENNELLRKGNVSTDEIEEARKISIQSGALGAKISGGGGSGGAVMVFAEKEKVKGIAKRLKENGYGSFEIGIAREGVKVERS